MTNSECVKEWYTAKELAGLPGMPNTDSAVVRKAKNKNWQSRKRRGKGGGKEYHIASLPNETRKSLANIFNSSSPAALAGKIEAKKLALADDILQMKNQREAEDRLEKACMAPSSEKERDRVRSMILADWEMYRKVSGEPVKKSMRSYTLLYKMGSRPVCDECMTQIPTLCAKTIQNWRRIKKQQGHLGAGYGNRKGSGKIDQQPELKTFIIAMITDFPHCRADQVLMAVKARFNNQDMDFPSQGRLKIWMERWKHNHNEVFTALTNPDEWKNKYMSAQGSASEGITRLNQQWQFDGTPADVMFTDGRYSLNGVIDVYSRRGKLLVVPTSKAESVVSIFRRAIMDWGIPETVKIDNGKDYVAKHTTRVFEELGVETDICPPFSPWKKPYIERFFRSFSGGLLELLPGYIGHNVADRKEIESRQAFADRLFKKDQVIEIRMTSEEFQSFANEWCENIYQRNKHDGLGCTPWEKAASWTETIRRIKNERALDILLQPAAGKNGLRTISKKGLSIDRGNYIAPELGLHVGEEVQVFEIGDDLGRVLVKNLDGEFICIAECPERTGISRAEVAAKAHEMQKKQIQEKKRELKAAARNVNTATVVNEIMSHAAEKAGKLVQLPRPSADYTTPALEAAAEAAEDLEAIERRKKSNEKSIKFLEARLEEVKAINLEKEIDEDYVNYSRWKELDGRAQSGEILSSQDELWWKSFGRSAICKTIKGMEESWGEKYWEVG
ncbi:MAG: transposase [Candidatus Omnitrophica bacterium]|nr:transposase [Candidatus Omnitrophota bacterium]